MSDGLMPKIADMQPFQIKVEAEQRYSWCSCGYSDTQPFCDGAHKGKGFKSLPFTPTETKIVWLCQCKRTKNPPYCDGTHVLLEKGKDF